MTVDWIHISLSPNEPQTDNNPWLAIDPLKNSHTN